jgi:hypothetical protein
VFLCGHIKGNHIAAVDTSHNLKILNYRTGAVVHTFEKIQDMPLYKLKQNQASLVDITGIQQPDGGKLYLL